MATQAARQLNTEAGALPSSAATTTVAAGDHIQQHDASSSYIGEGRCKCSSNWVLNVASSVHISCWAASATSVTCCSQLYMHDIMITGKDGKHTQSGMPAQQGQQQVVYFVRALIGLHLFAGPCGAISKHMAQHWCWFCAGERKHTSSSSAVAAARVVASWLILCGMGAFCGVAVLWRHLTGRPYICTFWSDQPSNAVSFS